MNLKKIIICLIIVVGLTTGCGNNKENNKETPKNETKTVEVQNGKMETIKSKGFQIKLNKDGDNAVIAINNPEVKKDQAYIIELAINQKNGEVVNQEIHIPANMPQPMNINTNIKSSDVDNLEYKITETESTLRGNNKKS